MVRTFHPNLEVRDYMLGFDVPFNPLRVKGGPGRDRKKRKVDSEDDIDGLDSDEVGFSRPSGPFQRIGGLFCSYVRVTGWVAQSAHRRCII
ncbi:hypothetical protein HAX54_006997 [Datura stramonium]|uniref:Uncharacterized protein n=1 Tax=Datura stramonium TaxID=4076 RepID=A0ABS8RUN4_DATST|nr:hypothetical protein [Datura stramonium]